MSTIHVLATVTASTGCREQVATALSAVVDPTRGEPGCLSYELFGKEEETDTFVFVERWRDQVSLDEHMGSAHVAKLVADLAGLTVGPARIEVIQPIQPPTS